MGPITSGLIMEIMNKNCMIRYSILFHFFSIRFRRIRTIISKRIIANVTRIRNVRTNLDLFRNGLRFTNLRRLIKIVKQRTRHRTAIRSMFAWARHRVSSAFFYLLITSKMMIRQAYRAKRTKMMTIAVLITRCLLRSSDRLFLISGITHYLRMYLQITRMSQDVCSLSNVTRRTRRLMLIIRVKGRMNIMSTNRKLMIQIFRRQKQASNGQQLRRIRRNRRILRRTIKRLYFRRMTRSSIVINVKRNCLVRVINVRGLIRRVNARRSNLKSNSANVLGLFRLKIVLRRIISRDRSTPLTSRQAITGANGIKMSIGTITPRSYRCSLIFRLTMFRSDLRSGFAINVRILRTVPNSKPRRLYRKGRNAQMRPTTSIITTSIMGR